MLRLLPLLPSLQDPAPFELKEGERGARFLDLPGLIPNARQPLAEDGPGRAPARPGRRPAAPHPG